MNEKLLVKLVKNEEKKLTKYPKPARRHTIALSTLDLLSNKSCKEMSNQNSFEYEALTNIFVNTNDIETNFVQPYNEFNFLTNQELRQQLKSIEKNSQPHIFRQSNKSSLEKDLARFVSNNLTKPITSKSIGNLPSLIINGENTLKQTISNLNEKQENQVKTTILNLSPLSISASSVTTTGLNSTTNSSSSSNSSSINSLINNTNKNKIKLDQVATNLAGEVGSITKTAVNTIGTESRIILEMMPTQDLSHTAEKDSSEITNKFHTNFVKQQNIQFNCTFESLI